KQVPTPEPGYAPIPDDAKLITVLVHGFNVNDFEVETGFIPPFVKRLYWTNHQVLSYQGDADHGYAHTVTMLWPGDQGKGHILDVPGVGNLSNLFFFPVDEFHALQTGIPLAWFLLNLKTAPDFSTRQLDVIAHSLGNMAVNSALMLLPPQTIR